MLTIQNYEIAFSVLPNDMGQPTPIMALSFAWKDTGADEPVHVWIPQNCQMKTVDQGLWVSLNGLELLFPLSSPTDQGKAPGGPLDRQNVLTQIQAHKGLFVCAFDDDGEMLQSIGFLGS